MRIKYFILGTIFILFSSFIGCNNSSDNQSNAQSESQSNAQNDNSVYLSEENDGMTLEIDIAEKIVIKLQSNPSTGYHWEHSNIDGTFINQDGDAIFTEDEECAGLDGCGGTEQLSFTTSQTGTGAIALVYHRSFEEEPIDQFSIDVIVTD